MPAAPVQVALKRIGEPVVGQNGHLGNVKALDSDILVEHDAEIVVRDGARLYVDIYRPADSDEKIPAILSWSFYGKKYSALDMLPICIWQCCVTKEMLSGLEKFEGLDPAHLCPRGYAIISVDSRGAGNSDGQISVMGTQDAEDGYDVVEAIAKMDWGNGSIGMAGNSWKLRSHHLTAIAPWEGMNDIYRGQFCRGGRIGGQQPSIAKFTSFSGPRPEHELNMGEHIIHFGPDYPSKIVLPFVDVKV
ncbi:alpha/beta-hydrolase, partial [Aureobasidium melanogenum]